MSAESVRDFQQLGKALGEALRPKAGRCTLGVRLLDTALGGGLEKGALHECAPASPLNLGAASSFVLGLARRACEPGRSVVWIQQDFARLEGGLPYAPGCAAYALTPEYLLVVRARARKQALWATEEALRCRAVGATIVELAPQDSALDLTTTRRLSLAAQEGDGLGLYLRQHRGEEPSAAATRWTVRAAAGAGDGFGGLGHAALALSLTKNRRGPCGSWTVRWEHRNHVFVSAPHPVVMAAATRDRPAFAHERHSA